MKSKSKKFDIEKITWPTPKKVFQQFVISLVGMISLVIFLILVDSAVSAIFSRIY